MTQSDKYILNYVGDDGEFHYAIDVYAEQMLRRDMILPTRADEIPAYQPNMTDPIIASPIPQPAGQVWSYDYPRPWEFSSRQRERIVIRLLILAFWGLLAIGSLGGILGLGTLLRMENDRSDPDLAMDQNWLQANTDNILDENITYQYCMATPVQSIDVIYVYDVTADGVFYADELDTSVKNDISVAVPNNGSGWYQLPLLHTDIGQNIVLAEYFSAIECD